MTVTNKECCGWPEIGVCPDCPDAEVVAWGKAHPPAPVETPDGNAVFMVAGSQAPSAEFLAMLDGRIKVREEAETQ